MYLFRRTLLAVTALWIVSFAALLYLQLFHPLVPENSSKYARYRTPKKALLPTSIFQFRTGITKDFWIASPTERTHYTLSSLSSTIHLAPSLTETFSEAHFGIYTATGLQLDYLHKTATAAEISSPTLHLPRPHMKWTGGELQLLGKVLVTLQIEDL